MDEHSFRAVLRDLAQTGIPDDYDRWEEIAMKLNQTPLNSARRPRRVRRMLLIAAALLLLTTASYAVYQRTQPYTNFGDSGLTGVVRAGLATELNLAQQIGEVEVRLDWAYLDAARLSTQLDFLIVDEDGDRHRVNSNPEYAVRILDRDGLLPDLYLNRSGNLMEKISLGFNLPNKTEMLPETLNLRMELVFTETPRVLNELERIFGGSSSRYGAYFGPRRPSDPRPPLPDGVGPFVFDFSLPVRQAVVLTMNESVTVNGITVTLNRVAVSPSQTRLEVCYTQDSQGRFWTYDQARLRIGKQVSERGSGTWRRNCGQLAFDVYAQLPAEMAFTIPIMSRHANTPEEFEALKTALESEAYFHGLEYEVEDGKLKSHTWPVYGIGRGSDEVNAVLVEQGYLLEGPWVFILDVPATSPPTPAPEITAEPPSP